MEVREEEADTRRVVGGRKRAMLISLPRPVEVSKEKAASREEGGRRRVQLSTISTTEPEARSVTSTTYTSSTISVAPPSNTMTLSPNLTALAAEIKRGEEQVVEWGDEGRHLLRLDRLKGRFLRMVRSSSTSIATSTSPSRYVVFMA